MGARPPPGSAVGWVARIRPSPYGPRPPGIRARERHLDEPAVLDLERQVVLRDRLQAAGGGGGNAHHAPQPGPVVELVERTGAGSSAGDRAGSGPPLLVQCGVAYCGRLHAPNAALDAAQVLVGDQGQPTQVLHLENLVPTAAAPRGQVLVTLPASRPLNEDRGRRLVQEARAKTAGGFPGGVRGAGGALRSAELPL